jgi:hypothetical protein
MKRALALTPLVLGLFCLMAAAAGGGAADLVLLDVPKGAWLATVRGDAAVTVLEERDGWRRVRLEGWTMAAPGPTPAQAGAGVAGARIEGVLAPDIRTGGTAGAGVLVLLLRDSEALDAEHGRAGEECGARVREKDRQIEDLRAELQRALNSSSNFREATTRNDQARARLKGAERERLQAIEECRSRAEEIFQRFAVARAISDGNGRFGFEGVTPGHYRVVALEPGGDRPRSWSFGCIIEGTGTRVLDPRADRTAREADWGVR